jgi:hypothetical protein
MRFDSDYENTTREGVEKKCNLKKQYFLQIVGTLMGALSQRKAVWRKPCQPGSRAPVPRNGKL